MVVAEQVERPRQPLVVKFLLNVDGHDAGLRDALESGHARAEVERFFAQHRTHASRERREAAVREHLQLIFAVAVHVVLVCEQIQPMFDGRVERDEQAGALIRAPLQHFFRFDAPVVAEMIDEEMAHLIAMTSLFDEDAADGIQIVFRRRVAEKKFLLFV